MTTRIAVIPARGGSKRLPHKNKLLFDDKPMLAHTVIAACASGIFTEVLFSSDDDEMLCVAENCGALPIKRPAEFATDTADFYPTVIHALDTLNYPVTSICLLMPNCPLRNADDIKQSDIAFQNSDSDFMISVFRYHMFYPFWAMKHTKEGLIPFFKQYFVGGSNDFETVYCPSGAIWWASTLAYKKKKDFYGSNLQPFVLPWYRAIDIDDADDLKMAKIVSIANKFQPDLFE